MLELLGVIRQLASGGDAVARLFRAYTAATRGDPAALAYFRSRQAAMDVAAVLFPGREWMVNDILDRGEDLLAVVRGLVTGQLPWVEGQFRPADSSPAPPWAGFLTRLRQQDSGGHIIIGPRGSGKTTLGKKLAWVWHQELGYTPEFLNMYHSDRPSWGTTITTETLVSRIDRLHRHLKSLSQPDPDEGPSEVTPDPGLPPQRRVIVIDESSLAFQRGSIDTARNAVFAAMGNARHVSWLLVFIAQWARMIPLELFADVTFWVKRPRGTEARFDRDDPFIIDLWEKAHDAFKNLKHSPWYAEPYDHPEAWAYVRSAELNYEGLVPFTPPDD